MFENILKQVTPEMMTELEEYRQKSQRNVQKMIAFMESLKHPNLNCDEFNARKMLDIMKFVQPCDKCDKKVCSREVCKLTTIDEICLYKGEIFPRYMPNCRIMRYYPTFPMLAHTIHEEH